MKIKDAMQVLEAFKAIAGDDAETNIDHIALRSSLSVEYYQSMSGSYYHERREEKSRVISYSVDVVLPPSDKAQAIDPEWMKKQYG